jgi:hypothetical protein
VIRLSASGRPSRLCRWSDLDELPRFHIVDVPIDGNALRHQRVSSNARDVIDDRLCGVGDCKPVDKLGFRRAWPLADIAEALGTELRRLEALRQ